MKLPRSVPISLAICAALSVGAFLGARHVATSSAQAPPPSLRASTIELHVPHAAGSIVLDGDTDDPGWQKVVARTGPLLTSSGAPARPYSDARVVWGDGHLYFALYAADEDIRATNKTPDAPLWLEDAFQMVFTSGSTTKTLDVSPLGIVTDGVRVGSGPFDYAWQSGAHVSYELDGTANDSRDEDEEWVIEIAIPFESLGMRGERGERIGLSLRRCDTPKGGTRVCASWGSGDLGDAAGVLVLD